MLVIYFSGTGNTKYCAERFANNMGAVSYSIENDTDFDALITAHEEIVFFYPIYGSCVPRIMREFVDAHNESLDNKKIMIFCTQLLFSGDGSRVFTELLEGINCHIIYADHFNMPNNISNVPIVPVKNGDDISKKIKKANIKIDQVCENIKKGIVVKRGFNSMSKASATIIQRAHFINMEKKAASAVRISSDCISCGKCCECCPMDNLELVEGKVQCNGNCTLCYRCINLCPTKAITVFLHMPIKKDQYHGIPEEFVD